MRRRGGTTTGEAEAGRRPEARGHALALDGEDFEMHGAGGDHDLDIVASLLAEERLGEGRGDGDEPLFEVGLAFGDDGVGLLHVVFGVFDADLGEEEDLGSVDFGLVEKASVGNEVLQFGDTRFEMALGLFGGVVFGIFGEVALVACFGDGCGGSGAFDGDKVVELVFEFLQTLFTIIFDFRHDGVFLPWEDGC